MDTRFHLQALAFRESATLLEETSQRLFEESGDADIVRKDAVKLSGYANSAVVLLALSTECALKAISQIETGGYKYAHDLQELYDCLSKELKESLESMARDRGISLRAILSAQKNDFVDWRYPTDKAHQITRPVDTRAVLEILFQKLEMMGSNPSIVSSRGDKVKTT